MPGFLGVSHGEWKTPAPVAATATRLYVAGNSGAIYKSANGGASWTTLTGHGLTPGTGGSFGFFRLAVFGVAGGNDVVYVAAGGLGGSTGIAVSVDGGATWATRTGPTGGTATFLEVDASGGVYCNGLYRSSNQGVSWALIPSSGFMENATATKLWSSYSATEGIRMNYDGTGQTILTLSGAWGSGPSVIGASDTAGLAFGDGNDSAHILEKIIGTTATVITPPTSGAVTDDPFLWAASNDGGTTILALVVEQNAPDPHIGQLWRSGDGGSSWTKVVESEDIMPPGSPLVRPHIAYDPTDTALWYAIGGRLHTQDADAVVWQSTDNGATWNSGAVAPGETLLACIRAVSG